MRLPEQPPTVQLNVPPQFLSRVPSGHGIQLFAQLYHRNSLEEHDDFDLIPSTFNPTDGVVSIEAPVPLFTTKRVPGLAEAVFILGTIPVNGSTASTTSSNNPIVQTSPLALAVLTATDDCDCDEPLGSPFGQEIGDNCEESGPPCVSSPFTDYRDTEGKEGPHTAVDIATPTGTPILATHDGTVRFAGDLGGRAGKHVLIHGECWHSGYSHLQNWNVSVGQPVTKGDIIGWVNSTGSRVDGPHLHWTAWPKNADPKKGRVDPLKCDEKKRSYDGTISLTGTHTILNHRGSGFFCVWDVNTTLTGKIDVGKTDGFADWTQVSKFTGSNTDDPDGVSRCSFFQFQFDRPINLTVNQDTVTANESGTAPDGNTFSLDFEATASDSALTGNIATTNAGTDNFGDAFTREESGDVNLFRDLPFPLP